MTNNEELGLLIFISYAHEDIKAVEGLRKPLALIERNYHCRIAWYDQYIKPGEFWRKEIESHLRQAGIAILLVSSDFLNSDFIQDHELPVLLSRLSQNQVILLPLLLGEVDIVEAGLSEIQFVNPPDRPLNKLRKPNQEHWYCELAKRVKGIIVERLPEAERPTCDNSEKSTITSSEREPLEEESPPDALTWSINCSGPLCQDSLLPNLRW